MAGIVTEDGKAGLARLAETLNGTIRVRREDVEKETAETVDGIMKNPSEKRKRETVWKNTYDGKIIEVGARLKANGKPAKRYHYDFLFEDEYRVEVKRMYKAFTYLNNSQCRLNTFITHCKGIDYLVVGDYESISDDEYEVKFAFVAIAYKFETYFKDSRYPNKPRYFNHVTASKAKNAIVLNQSVQDKIIVV